MANDIAKSNSANAIKHGTVVLSASPHTGYFRKEPLSTDAYVVNIPLIAAIEGKYTERFDDPNYYHGATAIDGGTAPE